MREGERGAPHPLRSHPLSISGFAERLYSFDKTRPAFNKTWKTIAIEQQAHGHTNDIKDRPLAIEQMAEDTYALLKQLKVDSADFFGWSMGGGIALQIALKHMEDFGAALTPELREQEERLRAKDRAAVRFRDMKAIKSCRAAFENIVRQWIAYLS